MLSDFKPNNKPSPLQERQAEFVRPGFFYSLAFHYELVEVLDNV
jgi:hypothetical protein